MAERIAEEVEINKTVVYNSIKPTVRKQLVENYQLHIERTCDQKWKVSIDKPVLNIRKKQNKLELKQHQYKNISAWFRHMKCSPDFRLDLTQIKKYHRSIGKHIESHYTNLGSRKNHFATLGVILRKLGWDELSQIYITKMKDINNILTKNIEKYQEKSEREQYSWRSYDELCKMRNYLEEEWREELDSVKRNYNCLILSLNTLRPPLRLEYANMKIISPNDPISKNMNYLIRHSDEKYELLIQKDKVSNSRKEPLRDFIKGKLIKILTDSLTAHPRKYLFTKLKNNDEPIGRNGYSKLISRINGRKLTNSMFRSAYVTKIYSIPNLGIGAKRELARLMRETPSNLEIHYYKPSEKVEINFYD